MGGPSVPRCAGADKIRPSEHTGEGHDPSGDTGRASAPSWPGVHGAPGTCELMSTEIKQSSGPLACGWRTGRAQTGALRRQQPAGLMREGPGHPTQPRGSREQGSESSTPAQTTRTSWFENKRQRKRSAAETKAFCKHVACVSAQAPAGLNYLDGHPTAVHRLSVW